MSYPELTNNDDPESNPEPAAEPDVSLARGDDLTRFQIDILAVIAGYETRTYQDIDHYPNATHPHGLAIKEILSKRYDSEVNHGRLYPNLDQLERKGLIEVAEKDKRTNEYQLTQKGIDTITARAGWLAEVTDPDWEAMQNAR